MTRERSNLDARFERHRRSRRRGPVARVGDFMLAAAGRVVEAVRPGSGLASDGTTVVYASHLELPLLRDLFEWRTSGLVVRNFCDPTTCARLTNWLSQTTFQNWTVQADTSRTTGRKTSDTWFGVGMPISMLNSRDDFETYSRHAVDWLRELRSAAVPSFSPIDQLRLELDELWPNGAQLGTEFALKHFAGIARRLGPETLIDGAFHHRGFCHVDDWPRVNRKRGRFSANIYLSVPASGGELDVWNVSPTRLDVLRHFSTMINFADAFHDESQSSIRSILPEPLCIHPKVGDLVIINAGRPHAVRGFTEGERMSLQSFIRYEAGRSLTLFS